MDEWIKQVHGTKPLVLVLEDDHGVRRSLQLLLQGRGFDVRAYASAEALLADPQAAKAGSMLADYRLSASDGIRVLETLRARGWSGAAILMTAFASDDLTARAKSAGFMEVLHKPFRDHALVTALNRASALPVGRDRL
jgi:FixJ family two-component response regulator